MSNLSDFIGGGGKPKLITSYTSGTGTHVPTEDNARCFVRIQGGGGGGSGAVAGTGGGGGAMVEIFVRVPIAGEIYVVGASAASGTTGNVSKFGNVIAEGGYSGGASGTLSFGGMLGQSSIRGSTLGTDTIVAASGVSGIAGGSGGSSSRIFGCPPGYPVARGALTPPAGKAATVVGCGAGGDSAFGVGGAGVIGATGGNATGYGGGGGACTVGGTGGTGSGGYIEIWDFGA